MLVLEGAQETSGGEATIEQAMEQVSRLIAMGEKPTDACKAVARETGFRKRGADMTLWALLSSSFPMRIYPRQKRRAGPAVRFRMLRTQGALPTGFIGKTEHESLGGHCLVECCIEYNYLRYVCGDNALACSESESVSMVVNGSKLAELVYLIDDLICYEYRFVENVCTLYYSVQRDIELADELFLIGCRYKADTVLSEAHIVAAVAEGLPWCKYNERMLGRRYLPVTDIEHRLRLDYKQLPAIAACSALIIKIPLPFVIGSYIHNSHKTAP